MIINVRYLVPPFNINFNWSRIMKLRSLCSLLLLLISSTASAFTLSMAGKTVDARGQVDATNPESQRQLTRRAPIFKEDIVKTGVKSTTHLRMIDDGLLSIQPQSELAILDYQFNAATAQGSASLNLIKGGLRTITGALKSGNNSYQMTTPIASIGVRGTVYEAEMLNGDLILAVWQGLIDIQVTVGVSPQQFSLGEGEDYQFAKIYADGSVEFLLTEPTAFAQGHSSSMPNSMLATSPEFNVAQSQLQLQPLALTPNVAPLATESKNPDFDRSGNSLIDNDRQWASLTPSSMSSFTERSGDVSFGRLIEHNVSSYAGDTSNFSMSMTINFDTGRIPLGQMSFNDSAGQWFAAFDGIIGATNLEMNINFAAHNNQLATGTINGILLNNDSALLGSFQLYEVENSNHNVNGYFVLAEQP
jgi:hypothetical protein